MGRAAGAALTVLAPEARAASAVAAAGRRRPAAPDPRVTAPGSSAARQRAAVEQIKADRPPADPAPAGPPPASPGDGPPARAGWSPSAPTVPAAVSTGSGFALGVLAWALGVAYLQHGPAGVKAWLAAKFLNRVTAAGS